MTFMQATANRDQISRFSLRTGDILITKDSETADDIAVPAYVSEDLPHVLCGYHLALLRPGPQVDHRYLFWTLASRSTREQFAALATGVTRFGLRYEAYGEVTVPVPSLATQRIIAEYLDRETARLDALIGTSNGTSVGALGRLVSLLSERREALITAAVTGELDIPGVPS
jgi:type I restriction enzyme S subunit